MDYLGFEFEIESFCTDGARFGLTRVSLPRHNTTVHTAFLLTPMTFVRVSCALHSGFKYLYQIQKGIRKLKQGCDVAGWGYLMQDVSIAKLKVLDERNATDEEIKQAEEELNKNNEALYGDPNNPACRKLGAMPSNNPRKVKAFKSRLLESTELMSAALAGQCGNLIRMFAEGTKMQQGMESAGWNKCKHVQAKDESGKGFETHNTTISQKTKGSWIVRAAKSVWRWIKCVFYRFLHLKNQLGDWFVNKINYVKTKMLNWKRGDNNTAVMVQSGLATKEYGEAKKQIQRTQDDTFSALATDPASWFLSEANAVMDERMAGMVEVQERGCTVPSRLMDWLVGCKKPGFIYRGK